MDPEEQGFSWPGCCWWHSQFQAVFLFVGLLKKPTVARIVAHLDIKCERDGTVMNKKVPGTVLVSFPRGKKALISGQREVFEDIILFHPPPLPHVLAIYHGRAPLCWLFSCFVFRAEHSFFRSKYFPPKWWSVIMTIFNIATGSLISHMTNLIQLGVK